MRHDGKETRVSALAASPKGADEQEHEGKLFELPAIVVDESNPTAVSIAFSGSIVLDRSQKSDMDLYNQLKHGKIFDLQVSGLVKGSKKTHRRDSEGNVDAIVETKSLVIDSIDTA
jgi:hypothetical protein